MLTIVAKLFSYMFFRGGVILFNSTLFPFRAKDLASELYLGPFQTSLMEFFAKINNSQKPWTIFAKNSIINAWNGLMHLCISLSSLAHDFENHLQILLLLLSEFKRINYHIFPMKSLDNQDISGGIEVH